MTLTELDSCVTIEDVFDLNLLLDADRDAERRAQEKANAKVRRR